MTIKLHDIMLLLCLNNSIRLVEPVKTFVKECHTGKPSGTKILEGKHFCLDTKTAFERNSHFFQRLFCFL